MGCHPARWFGTCLRTLWIDKTSFWTDKDVVGSRAGPQPLDHFPQPYLLMAQGWQCIQGVVPALLWRSDSHECKAEMHRRGCLFFFFHVWWGQLSFDPAYLESSMSLFFVLWQPVMLRAQRGQGFPGAVQPSSMWWAPLVSPQTHGCDVSYSCFPGLFSPSQDTSWSREKAHFIRRNIWGEASFIFSQLALAKTIIKKPGIG